MRNKKALGLMFVLFFLVTSSVYGEGFNNKKLVFVLEDLDFSSGEGLFFTDYGLGILNTRKKGREKDQGYFLSINAGRRVDLNKPYDLREDFSPYFKDIKSKRKYHNLGLLGDQLKTAYIGRDSSRLILVDSQGRVDYEYPGIDDSLEEQLELFFKEADLVVVSNLEDRVSLDQLKPIIEKNLDKDIMLLPKGVSKEMESIYNRNLSPFVYYRAGEKGLLSSRSTNRRGFISLEDISRELLDSKDNRGIGHPIVNFYDHSPRKSLELIYRENLNLLIIASIFHGLVYSIQGLAVYFLKKSRKKDLKFIYRFSIATIFISFVLMATGLHRYLLAYLLISLSLIYILARYMDENLDFLGFFASLSYLLIVFASLIDRDLIYSSYLGFNNLFYGIRYYGFNNGIMGVLLGSSLALYHYMEDRIESRKFTGLLIFLIFGLNIYILSANLGANTGGFISSVILLLYMIYRRFFEDSLDLKRILGLGLVGILIFALGIYLDSKSLNKSHAFKFFERIRLFGLSELINMLGLKLREFLKFSLLPPFSLIFIGQLYILKKLLKVQIRTREFSFLFLGLITWIINDTGMISMIYILNYGIAHMILKEDRL